MKRLSDIKGLLPEKKEEVDMGALFTGCDVSCDWGFNESIDLMDKTIDEDRLVEIIEKVPYNIHMLHKYRQDLAKQIISKMGEWIK